MRRVRVAQSGSSGGPGLSTFYFTELDTAATDAVALAARVRAAFATMTAFIPLGFTYTVSPQVDTVDPSNGQVTASDVVPTAPTAVAGAGSGNIAPPQVAALIRWQTSQFNAGRRLEGRTFITGMTSVASISATGILTVGAQDAWRVFGVNLADIGGATADLLVWRRPREASDGPPPVTARTGSTGAVTSVIVPFKLATLNSRRDT